MKKILFIAITLLSVSVLHAQNKKNTPGFINRTGDHLMLQITSDHWIGVPDSIKSHMTGFARGVNVYVMLDKRFKSMPKMSVAFGLGVGTSNIFFKNMYINIKSKTNTLPFTDVENADHFKKYKLTTAFLELPIELRYTANPERENKSVKAAIGVKVGTVLNVHTKGKTLLSSTGTQINSYTAKETSKGFINSTRIAATARVGYGNFSVYGSYQLNNIFKDGVAADMKLFQIGICFSGL
ncbi:MAG: outer membrane beta-barrel protein [Ferruginibacter sp.]|nr:outer membrane beta-barrel protein [Bacteroidota bacterium]MBX2918234.1 outer membrane beta-barrel protein [Ferruginibacter sp.]MCB0709008.1 outer membrane beta-barrel protein [Chitinophagaceae bacterium]MCC7377832.1 outer membrane beta-barrel protein [Chitinophagaceae bacterium]